MSEIQSNLIPGSVWARTKKNGDVSYSTVLCVTNQNCSERVLEVNPNQVVFLTEQLQILSMTPEQFLNGRVYADIDTDVAAAMEVLTTEQDDEDDEDIDLDSVEIDENAFTKLVGEIAEGSDGDDQDTPDEPDTREETPRVAQFNALKLNVGPHPIASDLESSFVGYSEAPYPTGDTMHTLRFALNGTLSLGNIADAFLLSDPNAIQTFEVTTNYEVSKVEVSAYAHTLLESSLTEGDVAVVYLLTNGDFRDRTEVEETQAGAHPERGQSAVVPHVDEPLSSPQVVSVSVS